MLDEADDGFPISWLPTLFEAQILLEEDRRQRLATNISTASGWIGKLGPVRPINPDLCPLEGP